MYKPSLTFHALSSLCDVCFFVARHSDRSDIFTKELKIEKYNRTEDSPASTTLYIISREEQSNIHQNCS